VWVKAMVAIRVMRMDKKTTTNKEIIAIKSVLPETPRRVTRAFTAQRQAFLSCTKKPADGHRELPVFYGERDFIVPT
jgi:hypothetical protein